MDTRIFSLEGICLDEEIQARVERSDEYVREYAKDLLGDSLFPPVTVFDDGEKYYLADGFHRYEAHKLAGLGTIKAVVRNGSKREAILFAVGCNAAHGKRRTNEDKRKAVGKLLSDQHWSKWSDNEIARICRVSQPFVSKLRKELPNNGYKSGEKRLCANGNIMDTSNIRSQTKGDKSGGLDRTLRPQSEYQKFKAVMEKASAGPTALIAPYAEEDPDLLKQNLIRARSELKMKKSYAKWLESKVAMLKRENESLRAKLNRVNAA